MLRDCLAQALADVEASPLPGPKLSKKPWEAVVPNDGLCRSLRSLGYSSPLKVQSGLIRMLSQRNSLTITAPRRSGKTIALLCSIFLSVDPTCASLQAIYISTTPGITDEVFDIASELFDGISISQELTPDCQVLFGTGETDVAAIDLNQLRLLVLDNSYNNKLSYYGFWTLKEDFRIAAVFQRRYHVDVWTKNCPDMITMEYDCHDEASVAISCFYVPVDFLLEDSLKILPAISTLCRMIVFVPSEDVGRRVSSKIPNSRLVDSTAAGLSIVREFRRSLFSCLISMQAKAILAVDFANVKMIVRIGLISCHSYCGCCGWSTEPNIYGYLLHSEWLCRGIMLDIIGMGDISYVQGVEGHLRVRIRRQQSPCTTPRPGSSPPFPRKVLIVSGEVVQPERFSLGSFESQEFDRICIPRTIKGLGD
jgi:hypothetical protein